MGTRDKVLGDALYIKPKETAMISESMPEDSTTDDSGVKRVEDDNMNEREEMDILRDHLIEINKYKFGETM